MRYVICTPVIWIWAGCGPVPRDTVGSVVSCPSIELLFEGTVTPERPPSSSRLGVSIATIGQIRASGYVRFDREREGRVFLQRAACRLHLLTVPLSARAGRGHTDTVQYETQRVRAARPCTGFTEVYYARQEGWLAETGAKEACKRQGLTYSMRQSLPRRYAQSTHTPLSASQRSSSLPDRADTVWRGEHAIERRPAWGVLRTVDRDRDRDRDASLPSLHCPQTRTIAMLYRSCGAVAR